MLRRCLSVVGSLAAVALLTAVAGAQSPPASTVSASGEAIVRVKPSLLRMNLVINSEDQTMEGALAKLKQRRETVQKKLLELKADKDSIKFSGPTMQRQPTPMNGPETYPAPFDQATPTTPPTFSVPVPGPPPATYTPAPGTYAPPTHTPDAPPTLPPRTYPSTPTQSPRPASSSSAPLSSASPTIRPASWTPAAVSSVPVTTAPTPTAPVFDHYATPGVPTPFSSPTAPATPPVEPVPRGGEFVPAPMPGAGAPPVFVSTTVTAEWPLRGESMEELLVAAHKLRQQITAADLDDQRGPYPPHPPGREPVPNPRNWKPMPSTPRPTESAPADPFSNSPPSPDSTTSTPFRSVSVSSASVPSTGTASGAVPVARPVMPAGAAPTIAAPPVPPDEDSSDSSSGAEPGYSGPPTWTPPGGSYAPPGYAPGGYGSIPPNVGFVRVDQATPVGPQFVYVARLSNQQRQSAMTEAFGKAKSQAAELAQAAGSQLGGVAALGGALHGAVLFGTLPEPPLPRSFVYQETGLAAPIRDVLFNRDVQLHGPHNDQNEAVSPELQELEFRVGVQVQFNLK